MDPGDKGKSRDSAEQWMRGKKFACVLVCFRDFARVFRVWLRVSFVIARVFGVSGNTEPDMEG